MLTNLNTARAALFTALILLLLVQCKKEHPQESDYRYATVINKAYRIKSTGTKECIARINGYFSFNCSYVGNILWTYAKRKSGHVTEEGIFCISIPSGTMHLVAPGQLSLFIMRKSSILAVEKTAVQDSGFPVVNYHLTQNRKACNEKSTLCYLNITVNDWEAIGDSLLFLTGSRIDTTLQTIYRLHIPSGKLTKLYEEDSTGYFLKLVLSGKQLTVYHSATSLPNKKGTLRIMLWNVNQDTPLQPEQITVAKDQQYVFFGKGFTAGDEVFLPVLNPSGEAGLAVIAMHPHIAMSTIIPLPASFYRLSAGGTGLSQRYFIGHNYFTEPTTFYLTCFDSKLHAVVSNEKLP